MNNNDNADNRNNDRAGAGARSASSVVSEATILSDHATNSPPFSGLRNENDQDQRHPTVAEEEEMTQHHAAGAAPRHFQQPSFAQHHSMPIPPCAPLPPFNTMQPPTPDQHFEYGQQQQHAGFPPLFHATTALATTVQFYEARMRDHAAAYASAAASAAWAAAQIAAGCSGASFNNIGLPPVPSFQQPVYMQPPTAMGYHPEMQSWSDGYQYQHQHQHHLRHSGKGHLGSAGVIEKKSADEDDCYYGPNKRHQRTPHHPQHNTYMSASNSGTPDATLCSIEQGNCYIAQPIDADASGYSKKQKRSFGLLPETLLHQNYHSSVTQKSNLWNSTSHAQQQQPKVRKKSSPQFEQKREHNDVEINDESMIPNQQYSGDEGKHQSVQLPSIESGINAEGGRNRQQRKHQHSHPLPYDEVIDKRSKRRSRELPTATGGVNSGGGSGTIATHDSSAKAIGKEFKRGTNNSTNYCHQQHHTQSTRVVSSKKNRVLVHHYSNCTNNSSGMAIHGGGGPRPFNPVGKTGVSALHELCDKRHWDPPRFVQIGDDHTYFGGLPASGAASPSSADSAASPTSSSHYQQQHHSEFVISVQLNNRELGRGRGGTKASARQDAARRALAALCPGVVFDANGILLNVGDGTAATDIALHGLQTVEPRLGVTSGSQANIAHTTLEELAPNLASRLAIHNNAVPTAFSGPPSFSTQPPESLQSRSGCDSPALSENSSISTAFSVTNSGIVKKHDGTSGVSSRGGGLVVSGGLLQTCNTRTLQRQQQPLRRQGSSGSSPCHHHNANNIYPCASTTSGLSSASEGDYHHGNGNDDDNEYFASRGASVCSALLHAMAQIDDRIREPPCYTFDVCANPATLQQMQQQAAEKVIVGGDTDSAVGGVETCALGIFSLSKSFKRKGGVGGAIASKKQSVTNAVTGGVGTIHRSSFACTASLELHLSSVKNNDEQDSTEIEGLRKKEELPCGSGDTDAFQSNGVFEEVPRASTKIGTEKTCTARIENDVPLRLEAVGTGATKREARHVASAKLLSLLFPECSNMVEVKAAAEAARERYAASKALSKQSKRALSVSGVATAKPERKKDDVLCRATGKLETFSLPSRKADDDSFTHNFLPLISSSKSDPQLPSYLAKRLLANLDVTFPTSTAQSADLTRKASSYMTTDGLISVAALSLSERHESSPKNKTTKNNLLQIQSCDSSFVDSSARQLARQKQLEDEVDSTLHSLLECDDEQRLLFGHGSDDNVGRTILRRAGTEDSASVYRLLLKNCDKAKKATSPDQAMPRCPSQKKSLSTVGPLSLLGLRNPSELHAFSSDTNTDDLVSISTLLWGGVSFVLILSRAITTTDESPLGCAVLSLGFSMSQGRQLRISNIVHEEHLPRERFIECLEIFSKRMKCTLEAKVLTTSTIHTPVPSEGVSSKSPFSGLDDSGASTSELSRSQMKQMTLSYSDLPHRPNSVTDLDVTSQPSSYHGKKTSSEFFSTCPAPSSCNDNNDSNNNTSPLNYHLQSVKEEEECEEDEEDEIRDVGITVNLKMGSSGTSHHKPCKRTRVA